MLQVTYWQGKLKGQAFSPDGGFSKNTWASLPGGKGVQLANPQHMHLPIGKAELDRLTGLWRWWGGTNDGESAEPSAREEPNVHQVPDRRASIVTNGESGKQSLTLGEVSQGVFFNGTFKVCLSPTKRFNMLMLRQIVHMVINTPPKPALELYITDGTVSPSTTRNFHNVDIGIPASAIFSLAIKNTPPTTERDVFQVDNIITMNNIRAKAYQGDLELIWSELVTEEQKAQGWNRRRCHTLQAGDEIAKVIEA